MGLAKSIEAYSVFKYYDSETDRFIKNLSEKLNADFIITTYDNNYKLIVNQNEQTTFKKQYQYKLTITLDNYILNKEVNYVPTYELVIPIHNDYEDEINITFYPNQSIHIAFLTFEHLWSSFMETLKFKLDAKNRPTEVNRYQVLRNQYTTILHKLEINKIIISTHANYKFEDVINYNTFPKLTFDTILQIAIEQDNLTIFNFEEMLSTTTIEHLNQTFLEIPDLKILLLDTF